MIGSTGDVEQEVKPETAEKSGHRWRRSERRGGTDRGVGRVAPTERDRCLAVGVKMGRGVQTAVVGGWSCALLWREGKVEER